MDYGTGEKRRRSVSALALASSLFSLSSWTLYVMSCWRKHFREASSLFLGFSFQWMHGFNGFFATVIQFSVRLFSTGNEKDARLLFQLRRPWSIYIPRKKESVFSHFCTSTFPLNPWISYKKSTLAQFLLLDFLSFFFFFFFAPEHFLEIRRKLKSNSFYGWNEWTYARYGEFGHVNFSTGICIHICATKRNFRVCT